MGEISEQFVLVRIIYFLSFVLYNNLTANTTGKQFFNTNLYISVHTNAIACYLLHISSLYILYTIQYLHICIIHEQIQHAYDNRIHYYFICNQKELRGIYYWRMLNK